MGCIESTPVVEPQRHQVVYATYPIQQNQQILYPKQSEDPVNYIQKERPPPYNPNLNNLPNYPYLYQNQQQPYLQQQYIVHQYPYYYPTQQYHPYNNQPSILGTIGAVAGGVIIGDVMSDILFD
jgi:hypothetical protein